ncbi:hypothetical protein ABNQ38_12595 [Azospirillum sp. A29]
MSTIAVTAGIDCGKSRLDVALLERKTSSTSSTLPMGIVSCLPG